MIYKELDARFVAPSHLHSDNA